MKPDETRRLAAAAGAVTLERIYPHPPERVWQALTDPQALSQWLLPATFRPRVGHRFHFTHRPENGRRRKVQCRVVELEAPRRLAYTWQAEGEDAASLVTWTLDAVAEGTRLRLEHVGMETACALRGSLVSGALPRNLPAGQPDSVYRRIAPRGRIVLNTRSQTLRGVRRAGSAVGISHPARSRKEFTCTR